MRLNNENSTRVELSSILEGLLKANIKFILVGGLAAVVQGAPFTTLDVDIVYKGSSDIIVGDDHMNSPLLEFGNKEREGSGQLSGQVR
jgi:hypothetical protein